MDIDGVMVWEVTYRWSIFKVWILKHIKQHGHRRKGKRRGKQSSVFCREKSLRIHILDSDTKTIA